MTASLDRLHLFGIRHHGPGSARAVVAALTAADPAIVLIEGPPDADAMIAFAASPDMVPPVALLVHDEADPSQSSFYPFAAYSPEWQAMRWALQHARPVRFIDLPMANQLAVRAAKEARNAETPETETPQTETGAGSEALPATEAGGAAGEERTAGETDPAAAAARDIQRDPLGALAKLAGYEDGEAWWNALIEQGSLVEQGSPAEQGSPVEPSSPGRADHAKSEAPHEPAASGIFAAIETAMTELRAYADAHPSRSPAEQTRENQREAHMRLAIAAALKETDAAVAVVCGAWHIPALRKKVALADDRARLKGLPKTKVVATWVPWTDTRLASGSGYGAGVESPGWYAHLWTEYQRSKPAGGAADLSPQVFTARWQSRVAALLRTKGYGASTASVIEASRLAETLAGLRELALPGLDEMREATLAALLYGEAAPWKLIETELVIGRGVGEIDERVPQMPLAADLARQQKRLKMKPEALERELSLDLRSEAGLARSLLLHRLHLIDVPWGRLLGTGSSRGTFRENWMLRWDPEFSVRLAEALVHGTTVEQASGNAAIAAARAATSLGAIAEAVRGCLLAGLDAAARATIDLLQARAAATSDIGGLAGAVLPLAGILRYGTAREMPAAELQLLVTSLTQSVAAGLVYACRNLQMPEAQSLRDTLAALNAAIPLMQSDAVSGEWSRALGRVAGDATGHPLLRGFSARALYERGDLGLEATGGHLSRALSRSQVPLDAGAWLDGFLGSSGTILVHDAGLLAIIDRWVAGLNEEDFIQQLPMLVRSFAAIDKVERRRLLAMLEVPAAPGAVGAVAATGAAVADDANAPGFAAAVPLLLSILGLGPIQPLPGEVAG